MGYDLKRSHFSLVLEKSVTPGSVITEEGVLLQSELDAATGTEVVRATDGDTNDVIAGFAIRDNADHATTSEVESVVVPASAPFEVQLRNNNLVSGDGDGATASLTATDAGVKMDNLDAAGPAAADDVAINVDTGLLLFHQDDASKTIVVTYRYNLTVAESRLKFFQRNINNEASTLFGQVGVGQGHGEIFTDQFDAAFDWAQAATVNSGPAGILTVGTGVILDARVISVPNVNNPLLGISFDIGGSTRNIS
jgi:hypothetical protein